MPNTEPLPSQSTEVSRLLHKNLPFHAILEQEVKAMQYGQATVNVIVRNGVVDLSTLNIVVTKRIRY